MGHKRPIFMLVFDGKNGGAQCRWKMHYVGCTRNEADCPDKFRQEVPKVQGHRADARSGADNARSCTLRTSSRPDQIGSSQDVGSHTRTSLVWIQFDLDGYLFSMCMIEYYPC